MIVSPFNLEAAETHHHQLPMWLNLVDLAKVKAFVELTIASTVRQGAQSLFTVSACVCVHVCVYVRACMRVCVYTCVCLYVVCVCMYVRMYVHVWVYRDFSRKLMKRTKIFRGQDFN